MSSLQSEEGAIRGTLGASRAAQPETRQFSEAELYLELNDNDGDLGIHASIDGDVWTDLTIEGPGDRTLFELASPGRVRQQGFTQLFFESAEPTFDELAPVMATAGRRRARGKP